MKRPAVKALAPLLTIAMLGTAIPASGADQWVLWRNNDRHYLRENSRTEKWETVGLFDSKATCTKVAMDLAQEDYKQALSAFKPEEVDSLKSTPVSPLGGPFVGHLSGAGWFYTHAWEARTYRAQCWPVGVTPQ